MKTSALLPSIPPQTLIGPATGCFEACGRAGACGAASLTAVRGSRREARRRQRGSTSVAVAVSFVGVAAMTAVAVDIGHLLAVNAELQSVADVAAKSAANELLRIYTETGRSDPLTDELTANERYRIAEAANRRAQLNSAGGKSITITPDDVQIGKWSDGGAAVVRSSFGVDAIEVRARRDPSSNGLVDLFFPKVLGQEGVPLRAESAARVSGIRYLPPGVADFPVAIAKAWYAARESPCQTGNKISFYPTGTADGCAGWHTFDQAPGNASQLKSILTGLRTGTFKSPEVDTNKSQFMFNGGTVASAVMELERLYNAKKNAAGEMKVLIPVYDRPDCSNPQGWIRIIGVARAVVTNVQAQPDLRVDARVECDVVPMAAGGGTDFGVLAPGSDLVR